MALEIQERMARSGQFTIAQGANLSTTLDLRGLAQIMVLVPATTGLDSGTLLQAEASIDGTTFAPIESSQAQAALSMVPGTAAMWRLMPDGVFTAHFLRLHAVNVGGSDVAQAAARSISWMGKS